MEDPDIIEACFRALMDLGVGRLPEMSLITQGDLTSRGVPLVQARLLCTFKNQCEAVLEQVTITFGCNL